MSENAQAALAIVISVMSIGVSGTSAYYSRRTRQHLDASRAIREARHQERERDLTPGQRDRLEITRAFMNDPTYFPERD